MDNILVPCDIKEILIRRKSYFSSEPYDPKSVMEDWEKRDNFRSGTSWHLPSQNIIDSIVKYGPILSVGAGFGYTESLAKSQGADIISTDISPDKDNKWCHKGKYHCEVEKLSAIEAIQKYPDRNVFMAWPPYDHPMAYEVVSEMKIGNYLIYIGEGHGGCTGDDRFFENLYEEFEEIEEVDMASWWGINDYCAVYRKK
jgi:hypothetical protein